MFVLECVVEVCTSNEKVSMGICARVVAKSNMTHTNIKIALKLNLFQMAFVFIMKNRLKFFLPHRLAFTRRIMRAHFQVCNY